MAAQIGECSGSIEEQARAGAVEPRVAPDLPLWKPREVTFEGGCEPLQAIRAEIAAGQDLLRRAAELRRPQERGEFGESCRGQAAMGGQLAAEDGEHGRAAVAM